MTQADRVHSTPPTNTSALPADPTRRRFLIAAAVGSMVSASTLAAAALTPNDVPQAVTTPSISSPALRAAIGRLAEAHTELERAMEADYAANELFEAWERSHPEPKSKSGRRRWIRQMAAYHREVTPTAWQALIAAVTQPIIWSAAMPFPATVGYELADCHSAGAFHRDDARSAACAGSYSYSVLHSLAQTPFCHSIGPPTDFEALQLPSMHR